MQNPYIDLNCTSHKMSYNKAHIQGNIYMNIGNIQKFNLIVPQCYCESVPKKLPKLKPFVNMAVISIPAVTVADINDLLFTTP